MCSLMRMYRTMNFFMVFCHKELHDIIRGKLSLKLDHPSIIDIEVKGNIDNVPMYAPWE